MTGKKLFLILQSALYTLTAALLCISAVRICVEGIAARAADPTAWVYTREKAAAALAFCGPFLFISAAMTAVGWILQIRDEGQDKPVWSSGLTQEKQQDKPAGRPGLTQEKQQDKPAGRPGLTQEKQQDKPAGSPGLTQEKDPTSEAGRGISLNRLRLVVLALALVFIIAGCFNGSMRDVLYKAVKICTECVGLG